MDNTEEVRDFISELGVINKNKFTLQQTKNLYMGIIYEVIRDKKIFLKNRDLNEFLKEVFNQEYSDSAFNSRPYLASKLLRHISDKYDFINVSDSIKSTIVYLKNRQDRNSESDNKKNKENKDRSRSTIEEDTIGWFQSINKGKK